MHSPHHVPSRLPNLIFVPGAQCSVYEDYPKTCAALQDAGFDVAAVTPDWDSGASFEDLVHQVGQEIVQHIGRATLVVAHSRGANLAMPTVAQQPDIGAIIASPSMTCAEGYESNTTHHMVEERFPGQGAQIRSVGMYALARASNIPASRAAVMVGGQEIVTYPYMEDIAQATAEGFGAGLIRVPNAPHFIDHHDAYIEALVGEATRIRAAMQ